MDYNIVTLEVTGLLIQFAHYEHLIKGMPEEKRKIRAKRDEHLTGIFTDLDFEPLNKPVIEWKDQIKVYLQDLKSKDIHDLVEKLEKDVKKMKKLYKAERNA